MGWSMENGRPIYAQLVEQLQSRIVSGIYEAGSRMPSVRDLANEASVNPNTMQRALAELERVGLVYSERTNGRYITNNEELIAMTRKELAMHKIDMFISQMQELGFKREDTLKLMEEIERDERK